MEKREIFGDISAAAHHCGCSGGEHFGRVTMLNVIAGHLIEQALTALLYFVFLFVIAASMLTAEGQPFSRTRFCLQRCSSLCWFSSLSTIFSLGHRQAIGLCGQ